MATCAAVKIALFPPGYQLQLQLVILQTPHSVTATQPYTTGVTRHGGGHGLLILSVIFDMRPTALLNFVAKSCLEFAAPPSNSVCHTYLCLKAPSGCTVHQHQATGVRLLELLLPQGQEPAETQHDEMQMQEKEID